MRYALLAIVLLAGCAKEPPDAPRVELTDVGFSLHLPAPMQQALDSIAPGFRIVRPSSFRSDVAQASAASGSGVSPAAFAAIGDFDHDGTIDAVVEGASPGSSALQVIAVMNGPHPSATEVTRFVEYDADAVGVYLSALPPHAEGAFDVVAYPDSTVRYRWADGALHGTAMKP
jgi:hypothetical protein